MRTTCFLGAGATIDIGGLSTKDITKKVQEVEQKHMRESIPYIRNVSEILNAYYGEEEINFEDIFHALEQIYSYRYSLVDSIAKNYKPAWGAFIEAKYPKLFQQEIHLNIAQYDLIKTVANIVNEYDSIYLANESNSWHTEFWQKLENKSKLDIATLNYDTCIEKIIKNYNDGFENTSYKFKRFNPQLLSDKSKSIIMHLHGSIHFGYARTKDANEYTLTDNHEDLYCYNNYEDAWQSWGGRSRNTNQAGEKAEIGAIVTGLHKTDKIQAMPYSFYNAEFVNSLIRNNALLIIGYSFGDIHFNRLLEKIAKIHGEKRKVVFINYVDEEEWWGNPVENDLMSHEMLVNISMAFQEHDPFREYYRYKNPIESKDGKARVYLNGFKDAVLKYGDEIIDFLTS